MHDVDDPLLHTISKDNVIFFTCALHNVIMSNAQQPKLINFLWLNTLLNQTPPLLSTNMTILSNHDLQVYINIGPISIHHVLDHSNLEIWKK